MPFELDLRMSPQAGPGGSLTVTWRKTDSVLDSRIVYACRKSRASASSYRCWRRTADLRVDLDEGQAGIVLVRNLRHRARLADQEIALRFDTWKERDVSKQNIADIEAGHLPTHFSDNQIL